MLDRPFVFLAGHSSANDSASHNKANGKSESHQAAEAEDAPYEHDIYAGIYRGLETDVHCDHTEDSKGAPQKREGAAKVRSLIRLLVHVFNYGCRPIVVSLQPNPALRCQTVRPGRQNSSGTVPNGWKTLCTALRRHHHRVNLDWLSLCGECAADYRKAEAFGREG
jgi:hypothetical protein